MGHVAGVAGLEPTHDEIKTRCLTDLAIPHYRYYFPTRIYMNDHSRYLLKLHFESLQPFDLEIIINESSFVINKW